MGLSKKTLRAKSEALRIIYYAVFKILLVKWKPRFYFEKNLPSLKTTLGVESF